jgi:uncharacterized protein YdaU (DUF1376 family)
MTKNFPWFPLYPQAFMGDPKVQLLDATAVGAYFLLLCCEWTEGTVPVDDAKLAKLSKSGEKWPEIRDDVLQFFQKTDAGYMNARLEEIRIEQEEKHSALSEAGRRGAEERERRRREKERQQKELEARMSGQTPAADPDDLSDLLDQPPEDGGNGADDKPETKTQPKSGGQYDSWN